MISIDTATAQQIFEYDWSSLPPLYIIAVNAAVSWAGLLCHVFKQMHEHKLTFTRYWTNNESHSWRSLITLTIAFTSMTLWQPNAALYAYFCISYLGDSILNKATQLPVDNLDTNNVS